MKDSRFRESEEWQEQIRRAYTKAKAELDTVSSDYRALVAAAELVLKLDDASWAVLVAATFEDFRRVVADVQEFLTFGNNIKPMAWALLVEALAATATRGTPEPKRLERCRARLERAPPWACVQFEENCAKRIMALPPDLQSAWLDALARPLRLVEHETAQEGAIVVAKTEAKWSLTDVFQLWTDDNVAIVLVAGHAPTSLLRRLDLERWFRAVDGWEDGRLVAGALCGDLIQSDRDLLLSFLKSAAPVFDAGGAWTGRTAAVVLCDRVVEHGSALLSAIRKLGDDEIAEVREVELSQFFTRAWEVLLARPDGVRIAVALHAHLTGCDINLQDTARRTNATSSARVALAKVLAAQQVTTLQVRALWQERVRGGIGPRTVRNGHAASVYVVLSALELVECGGASSDELLTFASERIATGEREWTWLPERTLAKTLDRFAGVWAKQQDALERLLALYDGLEGARRSVEGNPYVDSDHRALVGSSLALLTLLATLDDTKEVHADLAERCARYAIRAALVHEWSHEPVLTPAVLVSYSLILLTRCAPERAADLLGLAVCDPPFGAEVVLLMLSKLAREQVEPLLTACATSLDEVSKVAATWAQHTQQPKAVNIAAALQRHVGDVARA